jgi:hypothetical protein
MSTRTKPGWPEGVRIMSLEQLDNLGIDERGGLYWHGKPVEVKSRFKLSRWQAIGALLVGTFAVIGAVGSAAQGWASYNDWGCRAKWAAVGCPTVEQSK